MGFERMPTDSMQNIGWHYSNFHLNKSNAAFTHAGLTTKYRKESLYESIFLLPSSRKRVVCEEDRKLASYCILLQA